MLRINLLPPYIFDKQKKIQMIAVWGVAAAVVVVLFLGWTGSVSSDLTAKKKELDEATDFKKKYDDLDTQIKGVNDKIAVTRSKQQFVQNALDNNKAWPKVYEAMRDVTTNKILLEALAVSPQNHKQLDFTGFAQDELTIARWWSQLRNATNTFDSVSLSLPSHPYVPGGGQGAAGGFGAQGRFGGGGRGMMGSGMPPGMGGTSSMGPLSSTPGAGMSMMGAGSKMAGMQMTGMGGGGGGSMGGGFGGARMGGASSATPAEIEGRSGLSFSGVAVIKDALAPPIAPTWPAGGAGGGMGGAPGMGAMMGGGRMGMMSSSPGSMMGGSGGAGAPPGPAAGGLTGRKGKGGDD